MKKLLPLIALLLFTCFVQAQRKVSYNNRLGLGADLTYFQLHSSDIAINSQLGFMGTAGTRGNFRDDFDLIYGVSIFQNKFSVQEALTLQDIDLSQIGVEFRLLLAWKVAQSDYFSLEIGPAMMINSEFQLADDRFESAIIGRLNPIAINSFKEVSPINLNGVVGFSAGARDIRITAHYHYAFIDALAGKNLADENLKGNTAFASAGIRFYF